MASVSPAEELELLQLIADAQTTNYLAAAGITVLVSNSYGRAVSVSECSLRLGMQRPAPRPAQLSKYPAIRYFTLTVVAFVMLRKSSRRAILRTNRSLSITSCPTFFSWYFQYLPAHINGTLTDTTVGNVYLHSDIGQRGFCARLAGLDTIWKIATLVVYLGSFDGRWRSHFFAISKPSNCTVQSKLSPCLLLARSPSFRSKVGAELSFASRVNDELHRIFKHWAHFEKVLLFEIHQLSTHTCQAVPRYFTFYAVPYLLMAILMFSMTLYKCSEHLLAVRGQRMPVITLFLRDGVFFFLTILLITIVELVIWHNGRPTLAQVPVMLHAVVGARVLLNIKNLATEVNDSTIPTVELSDISYRQRLFAAKARIPWYLQTGEPSNSEVLSEEIY
ncbi:hypothetical protein B0H14DRAFT_2573198 [Mycena olivaceomarginata]|nr:hypothetical protein B0H14DRAFT_2573198 [Mycena olivaceomarginata]